MAESPEREEIARQNGFECYADLLDFSDSLPQRPGDKSRSYIGCRPDGRWFVWEEPMPVTPAANDAERHAN